jgi:hypothetical protein
MLGPAAGSGRSRRYLLILKVPGGNLRLDSVKSKHFQYETRRMQHAESYRF